MLSKNIIIRCCNRTLQCKSYCSNHSNQQQQTCKNLQIWMNTVQRNSLICYRRSRHSQIIPERICISTQSFSRCAHILLFRSMKRTISSEILKKRRSPQGIYRKKTGRKRLPQCQKHRNSQTNKKDTCNWISSSLMCLNFCRRNVLKHNNKQKQNCQCSNIDQQLKKNKIFKSLQNQESRTMQKCQDQIKNRMDRIFRFCHLKNTKKSTCSNQRERLTHFFCKNFLFFASEKMQKNFYS